ncbi:hypothetical protein QJS04_geneDACA007663 [Acorus gramineus]|uniref:Uncharacterized protein n=1 Tax=Acorus gramineus TaxID=55184 RepID=A0AAV9B188_ACOGR|nr:hypothetical protein QJS04_geneDACA007663 [Acorus gramineus]
MDGVQQLPVKAPPPPPPEATKITLNRIVKMSKLFSFAAAAVCFFSNPPGGCVAVENSIVFSNLLSLAFFTFSAVIAVSLDLDSGNGGGTPFNRTTVRAHIIALEIGFVSGLAFFTLAIGSAAARVLIRRGMLSCDDSLITYAAEAPILLPALLICLFGVIYARTR